MIARTLALLRAGGIFRRRRLLVALVSTLLFAQSVGAQPVAQSFPSLADDRMLSAWLYRPQGAGPFPAIVLLHGCGGVGAHGKPSARHNMWAEQFQAAGYVALLVDSFAGRGLRELCTQKFSERSLRPQDRVLDAYAALRFLGGRSDVLAGRVGLMGWSHGGSTTLQAIEADSRSKVASAPEGFRAAVAMYPGCTASNRRAANYHPYAPLLILIGEADDWTPAAPCAELVNTVAQRGEAMRIFLYPKAYHDFDSPSVRLRVRHDVPNGTRPGAGVTVGPDAEAREDAQRRVGEFFARHLR